jgi:hypothetical protein
MGAFPYWQCAPTLFTNRMTQLRELLLEVAFIGVPKTGRNMMHADRVFLRERSF